MRNRNNEFILIFYIVKKDGRFRTLRIGRLSFAKRDDFSEGSSEPKKDVQVIRVQGAAAPRVF